jgi:hypothetical protein
MTPAARTLAALKADGYRCAVVERWNPHARIRQDLFGCIDILAIRDGETLAVQTTSASHVSHRVRKIADSEAIADIRRAGWRVEVHGWRKGSNGRWQCRTVDVS